MRLVDESSLSENFASNRGIKRSSKDGSSRNLLGSAADVEDLRLDIRTSSKHILECVKRQPEQFITDLCPNPALDDLDEEDTGQ